jgi:hypothetical protein
VAGSFTDAVSHDDGAVESYELIAVAARGFRPPRFLQAVHVAADEEADRPIAPEHERFRLTWSLLYRPVAETGPRTVAPYGIFLLGVNPPAGTNDDGLRVFNDFYTNVHMPEVVERRNALRAVRYELFRTLKSPMRGAPQFLAAYEVDEAGASNRRHTGPPYSSGPEVWQGHVTPWRLWYRRLASGKGVTTTA